MKRIKQLQPLSKEHHQSLRLAKKCRDIIEKESDDAIAEFSLQLKNDFETQWDKHFKIEENTIFNIAKTKGDKISEICKQLETEHQLLSNMVERISTGNYNLLHEFGQLLHDHTRMEERQLFPLIEAQFTQKELDNIFKYSR